jgi:hypothetical protein
MIQIKIVWKKLLNEILILYYAAYKFVNTVIAMVKLTQYVTERIIKFM